MAEREGQQVDTFPSQMYGWDGSIPRKFRVGENGVIAVESFPIPQGFQGRYDTDGRTDFQYVYIGRALMGVLTSEDGWEIWKYTYTTTGAILAIETSSGIWDSRPSYF